MKKTIRLILIGGFLGAGKTTALCRLAGYFADKALRTGVITNDQADNLVDTHLLKMQGFNTEEIAGGCFCCRFNDLIDAFKQLNQKIKPEVILAEPVGSCTDITATVIQPLRLYYKDKYRVLPYTSLLDPVRAEEIILSGNVKSFSPNITYIFKKQLEESDIIALNKIDTISPKKTREILIALKKRFPKSKVIKISAKTGQGFDLWIKNLEAKRVTGQNIADVDYDRYAAGEAELAWLNFVAYLSAKDSFDTDKLLKKIVAEVKKRLYTIKGEIAHIKLALSTSDGNSLINLTHIKQAPIVFKEEAGVAKKGRLIVNARVRTDPELLFKLVNSALKDLAKKAGIKVEIKSPQYFRPARPVPVHRIAGSS